MHQEESFLRAVLASPRDLASRLVYADWLEERGDPRSEYLRLWVARENLDDPDEFPAPARQRLAELQEGLDADWTTLIALDWERLYQRLKIEEPGPDRIAVPKPDDAWLDAYEQRTGFRMPIAYREFIKVFGPGELAGVHTIRAPGYRLTGHGEYIRWFNSEIDFDGCKDNRVYRTVEETAEIYEEPERITRLIYFASNISGDDYGWDPEDLRDPASREYEIYIVRREEDECARFHAWTFAEFIHKTVFDPELEEAIEDFWSFRPAAFHLTEKAEGAWLDKLRP